MVLVIAAVIAGRIFFPDLSHSWRNFYGALGCVVGGVVWFWLFESREPVAMISRNGSSKVFSFQSHPYAKQFARANGTTVNSAIEMGAD